MNRGGRMMRNSGYKPASPLKTLVRILAYLKDFRAHLALVFLLTIVSSLSTVYGTYMIKSVVNDYVVPLIGQENPDLAPLMMTLGKMIAVYLTGVVAAYLSSRTMVTVSSGMLRRMRIDMFSKIESLPLRYFDTRTHGEIMSHFTNDAQTMREMVGNALPNLVMGITSLTGVSVMMLKLSWQLSILVGFQLLFIFAVLKYVGGHGRKFFRAQQADLAAVNGFAEEYIEGQKVVKVFSHEPAVKDEFAVLCRNLFNSASEAQSFALMVMPILGNGAFVHYALTAMLGAVLVIKGVLDIGTIGAFLQYTRNFTQPINNVSQQLNTVYSALAGAERIFKLLDEEPEVDEGTVELIDLDEKTACLCPTDKNRVGNKAWKIVKDGVVSYTPMCGDVRFHDVTFSYTPDKTILKNVSLYAKPGQKIAFIGSTGAGKTTIINLITRFYDVDSGMITFDGIPLNEIRKDSLRSALGMVLQETHLFSGTVMENIRYGRLDASDEDVLEAARIANADSFIRHLPEGYQTMIVNDGANLSQGQRQLLAIARAAVADPPVLILDEATSSIDTRTEMLIGRGMDTLMEGRTVFVIAHRLSTVRNSNAIIVLEHGEIVERGDHDDLIAQQGRYYSLSVGKAELT